MVKSFLNTYMWQRGCDSKTIEFSFHTFGQDKETNQNHMSDNGYDGVNEIFPICHPSQDLYQLIKMLEIGPSGQDVDLISAVIVCFDRLATAKEKLAYNRVMILITDGEKTIGQSDEDYEDLQQVVGSMSLEDKEKKRQPMILHVLMIGKVNKYSSDNTKEENAILFKQLAEFTGGTYTEVDSTGGLVGALSTGIGLSTRPQMNRTFLNIDDFKMPCVLWSMIQEKKNPYLHKKWDRSNFSAVDNSKLKDISAVDPSRLNDTSAVSSVNDFSAISTVNDFSDVSTANDSSSLNDPSKMIETEKLLLSSKDSSIISTSVDMDMDPVEEEEVHAIKKDLSYFNPADDQENLSIDQFVDGYKYGSGYIPIDAGSKAAMKIEGSPGITLIGFLNKEDVPRHHYLENTSILQGSDAVDQSILGMAAISKAMLSKNAVGIARLVSRADADPNLVALIPSPSEDGTILVQHLPCKEDTHNYHFVSLPDLDGIVKSNPKFNDGISAVSNMVDLMTKTHVSPDMLTPSNPIFYNIHAVTAQKMMNAPASEVILMEDPFTVHAEDLLRNNEAGVDIGVKKRKLAEAFLTIHDIFPLQKKDDNAAEKTTKQYFSDLVAKNEDD